jgi:hypothetical protein
VFAARNHQLLQERIDERLPWMLHALVFIIAWTVINCDAAPAGAQMSGMHSAALLKQATTGTGCRSTGTGCSMPLCLIFA